MMKILHLSTARTWRGGEQQLVYLYEGIKKTAIEQVIITPSGSALAAYCRENGMNYGTFSRTGNLAGNLFRIHRMIRRNRPDILHAHDSKAHTFLFLLSVLTGLSIPLVVHRRTGFFKRPGFISRIKFRSSSLKKIICVSEFIYHKQIEITADPDRTVVVHSAIDRAKFEKYSKTTIRETLNIPGNSFIVGNIAALTQEKGLYAFIDTAGIVTRTNPDIRFVLIGDGPLRSELMQYIRQQKLENSILLTGFVSDSGALLAGFDVFLFTSVMEGLGTSVLDAFACHVPVIATRTGGIPEMVFDGKSGLLTEVNDSRMMAECVLKLYESEELRNRLVEGSEEVLNSFSVEQMTSEIINIYSGIQA